MEKQVKISCRLSLLALAMVMILVDQWTKWIVRTNMVDFQVKEFLPHWNWVLVYNEGAAFSFLANQGGWQKLFFGAVALVVSFGIIYFLLKKTYSAISGLAFSLILSGALGNLIDRSIHGKVTDFIDWYAGNYHWPAFNVADSCVCVGVALLIIESVFFSKNSQNKK